MKIKKIKLIPIILFIIFSISCSHKENIRVNISMGDINIVDLDKYIKILYNDFEIKLPKNSFNSKKYVKDFFLNDFSKAVEKKVEYFDTDTDFFKDSKFFLENLKNFSKTLLITGKIKIEIKSRSMIKKIKVKSGKRKKSFVQVQDWKMTSDIVLIDSGTGEKIYEKNFIDNIKDSETSDTKFNFETLFFKTTNKFIKSILNRTKIEDRYLLVK